MSWLLVALGAGVGAPCRYLLDTTVTTRLGRRLPGGTLVVNLLGSLALGVLAGLALTGDAGSWLVSLLGVGFCGAFTTASTFAWEVVALAEDGWPGRATAYLLLSTALGLALAGAALAVVLSV